MTRSGQARGAPRSTGTACERELKDGVLTMVVPKKPEAQAKRIPIAVSASKS
jgi:hypothetical protein